MQKTTIQLSEIKLIGRKIRTNNKDELDPSTAKIGITAQSYFQDMVAESIPDRKNPGTTICAYTKYESDFNGDYTYFIGEEVTSFDNISTTLSSHLIDPQTYTKFTTDPKPMPGVVIEAWQKIWQMTDSELGGKRAYKADFEVYDQRAVDHLHTIVDVYIGIDSN